MIRRRRRHFLVQDFQYKLIVRMFAYWFLYQITLWNFLFCWRLLQHGQGNFFVEYRNFCLEFYPMIFCFLALVPAFAWDAVRFYHGIAGPLVQFRRTIRDVSMERPVRRVRLRKTDELIELQDDFNDMLDTLVRRGAVVLADPKAKPDNKDHRNQTEQAGGSAGSSTGTAARVQIAR